MTFAFEMILKFLNEILHSAALSLLFYLFTILKADIYTYMQLEQTIITYY